MVLPGLLSLSTRSVYALSPQNMSKNSRNQWLLSFDTSIFVNTLSISFLAFSAELIPCTPSIPLAALRVMNAFSTRPSANHEIPVATVSMIWVRLVLNAVISEGSLLPGVGGNKTDSY